MSEIFNYFKRLLSGPPRKHLPFVHEVLERDELELQSYLRWKLSDQYPQTMYTLGELTGAAKDNHYSRKGMTLIDTPTIKGFVLRFDDVRFKGNEFAFLMDHFKETLLEAGYKNYTSDVKAFVKEEGVEKLERHYLKPITKTGPDGLTDQRYGNITIEHLKINERSEELRLSSSVYSDRNYTEAAAFSDLLKYLLQP